MLVLLAASVSRGFQTRIVSQDDQRVAVQVIADDLGLQPAATGALHGVIPFSQGASWFSSDSTGWLSAVLSVAVPPGSRPVLHILHEEWSDVPWPAPLLSAGGSGGETPARPGLRPLDLGWMRSQKIQRLALDLAIYRNGWQRLSQLDFELVFRPDPPEQALLAATEGRPGRHWGESPFFDRQFDRLLLNKDQAKAWRVDPARLAPPPQGGLRELDPVLDGEWITRVMVDEDGIVRVSQSDLREAGIDTEALDPATLSLWEGGIEHPLMMVDGGDGRLDPGDYFVFIGRARRGEHFPTSFYGPERAYFLTWGTGTGRRFIDRSSSPVDSLVDLSSYRHLQHIERDVIWTPLESEVLAPHESDHWQWRQFTAINEPATYTVNIFPEDAVDDSVGEMDHIRFAMRGNSDVYSTGADHHAVVRVDGQWVADLTASNQQETISDWFPLPAGILTDQIQVTLEFELPLDRGETTEVMLLNWMDLDYERRLNVMNNGQLILPHGEVGGRNLRVSGFSGTDPVILSEDGGRLMGARPATGDPGSVRLFAGALLGDLFLADHEHLRSPSRILRHPNRWLRNTDQQADMLIIAPEVYHDQLQDLADFHGQSMAVKLVDIESVYNEFGDGMMDARAIQDFIHHAFVRWQAPSPTYVTLVGKASTANSIKLAVEPLYRTQVPTWWVQTYTSGATATDESFTYQVGQDTLWTNPQRTEYSEVIPDSFQDLFVGRISVVNGNQLAAFLAKHREYREGQDPGRWMETQVFAADQGNDQAFEVGNELVAKYIVPESLPVAQIHVRGSSPYHGTALDFIDLFNEGCLVLSYNGHGSRSIYSGSSLFRATDIRFLTNQGKYPVCFAWSCNVGDYDNPDSTSLSELLLRKPAAGAIAFYSSSAKATVNVDNPLLTHYFYNHYDPAALSFGEIVQLTENSLLLSSNTAAVIHMYNLQGDPALVPALPRGRLTPSPAMLLLEEGEAASFTVATDPPGQSGTLEVTFLPFSDRPSNFQGINRRVWNQAFTDGQAITLPLPAIGDAQEGRLLLAMNTAAGRAVGQLPVFLNLPYAGVGSHSPDRAHVDEPLRFQFSSPLSVDSVDVMTNIMTDSLSHLRMSPAGAGAFVRQIARMPSFRTGLYRLLTPEWLAGWDIDVSRWPSFQLYGLIYRFRIYDGEPWTDLDGNGRYDTGEPYTDENGNGQWDPPGEPFNDADGDGVRDPSEAFEDLNGNFLRDGWIDLPGAFVSVLDNERLSAVDTLVTISAGPEGLEAGLRWAVSVSQDVEEASLRLSRQADDTTWVDLWSGRLPAAPGTQTFRRPVSLAPGPHALRFTAGPLWRGETRLEGVDSLVLVDRFHLLTPAAGSGGAQSLDSARHWSLDVPAGALPQPVQYLPRRDTEGTASHLREAVHGQPGLGFVIASGADSLLAAVDLAPRALADSAAHRPAGATLACTVRYGARSDFHGTVLGDSLPLALARWVPERSLWVVQPGTRDSSAAGWSLRAPLDLRGGWLAPVALRDANGPSLGVQVSGQWFAAGDRVPREPVFQFRLDDPDGLDLGEGVAAPALFMDGVAVPANQLQVGEGATGLVVQWSPGVLEAGSEHEILLRAYDALGNPAEKGSTFRVATDLRLDFFANHPNPFQDETVLAWQLTNLPRTLRFEIYTASGRLVRRLAVPTPRVGYDELVWDGRDQEGRDVANGVYFLRMVADGNGGVDETFKLARLR